MVSTAILIQKETGGNLAEVLDKSAAGDCASDSACSTRSWFTRRRDIVTGWIL